jgi:hypothetical protein
LWSSLSLFFFLLTSPLNAEAPPDVASLVEKAVTKRLHEERYWHVLLHYKPSGDGFKSVIDDPRFFLSPTGQENPKAELLASLQTLFAPHPEGDDDPRCRFIARYRWFVERLHLPASASPEPVCKAFADLTQLVAPQSASLIFPSFFMNNPASLFGHTLLRLDGKFESKLLSFAVNYAAFPDRMDFLYPFKGIFGFFNGYYSVFPYYDTVKKYNDTEQRDMWEYKLNLSKDEVDRMFLHLWELQEIASAYFYFDENCSYHLLFLLEAARPSLHLTDAFGPWVIPTDTLRAIKESGLIETTTYRPSRAVRMKHLASRLNEADLDLSLRVARGTSQIAPSETERRHAPILDLSLEMIQYRYAKRELTQSEYRHLFLETSKARSRFGIPEGDPVPIPIPAPPESGHRSNRLSVGVGRERHETYAEIGYRPAYHSLTDLDIGYVEGSQIGFGETTLRVSRAGGVRVNAFTLIDVVSISPRDPLFKPLSFKVQTGLTRGGDPSGEDHFVYGFNPGVGFAFQNKIAGLYYGLLVADLEVGRMFEDHYAMGVGAEIGAIRRITDFWKMVLAARIVRYELGARFTETGGRLTQTFTFTTRHSLGVTAASATRWSRQKADLAVAWQNYF